MPQLCSTNPCSFGFDCYPLPLPKIVHAASWSFILFCSTFEHSLLPLKTLNVATIPASDSDNNCSERLQNSWPSVRGPMHRKAYVVAQACPFSEWHTDRECPIQTCWTCVALSARKRHMLPSQKAPHDSLPESATCRRGQSRKQIPHTFVQTFHYVLLIALSQKSVPGSHPYPNGREFLQCP